MTNTYAAFQKSIKKALASSLPGVEAHKRMAPGNRPLGEPDRHTRLAAVLLAIFEKNNRLHTVFIKRSIYEGVHSGQIAFPGGQAEEQDHTLLETALRETHEEIGIIVPPSEVVGKLTNLYIPVSDFFVSPYVACLKTPPQNYIPDPAEVGQVLEIPLEELFAPDNQIQQEIKVRDTTLQAPAYQPYGHTIWGATAMILAELGSLLEQLPQKNSYLVF
ncbi:MAG: NUDIX hydrolase [Bacteroidota bacterium]|jgi:8-oxo-dGTP pyrophosphatase MutT (NUDIX family)